MLEERKGGDGILAKPEKACCSSKAIANARITKNFYEGKKRGSFENGRKVDWKTMFGNIYKFTSRFSFHAERITT